MSYLKLHNLTKQYQKDVIAVDTMDLDIKKGEFLVFLGPSGCGKTTTMRMIAGLEDVSRGDILLEGKSIKQLTPRERDVSMIFQSYAVWPHMTVYDNVAYALKLRKMKKPAIEQKVQEVAKVAAITEYLDRYPSQLSGGQRQRVAVARAMAVEPKLFLMDEPLSNLDAKLRVSMRADLKHMHNRLGSTSIFVTHDQSEAMSMADRIVVMNMGVIEQVGTPNEIYHDCETVFVANFIGSPSTNFIDVKVIEERGELFIKNSVFKYPVRGEMATVLRDNYLDQTVILGVRPENFVLNPARDAFTLDVTIVEPQGSHTIMLGNAGEHELKVTSTELFDVKPGDQIRIGVGEKFFLFDKQTQKRIRAPKVAVVEKRLAA